MVSAMSEGVSGCGLGATGVTDHGRSGHFGEDGCRLATLLTPVALGVMLRANLSAPATKPRSAFGDWLRARLDENKAAGKHPDSIRSLARSMAGGNSGRADAHKRSLFKWIRGVRPSDASRYLVAAALDCDISEVPGGEDEDEESEMGDLFRALMHRIDRRIDEQVRSRLGGVA
jgi:hypothetical protein